VVVVVGSVVVTPPHSLQVLQLFSSHRFAQGSKHGQPLSAQNASHDGSRGNLLVGAKFSKKGNRTRALFLKHLQLRIVRNFSEINTMAGVVAGLQLHLSGSCGDGLVYLIFLAGPSANSTDTDRAEQEAKCT